MSKILNTDSADICKKLKAAGMSAVEADAKAKLFARVFDALREIGADFNKPCCTYFLPGRLEFLGKHTDYAGGRSMLTAVERGFCLSATMRDDNMFRIKNVASGELFESPIDPDLNPTVGSWTNYIQTVLRRVARNFPGKLRGADVAFISDLPPAAGMSSSSALLTAIFLILEAGNDLPSRAEYKSNITDPHSRAGYAATLENGQNFGTLAGDKGVGTFGGSEDHTTILCGKAEHFSVFSFCPVRLEQVIPFPKDYIIAIASCGVLAEKTGAAMHHYNTASARVTELMKIWRQATGRNDPHPKAVVDSSPDAVEKMKKVLAESKHPQFSPKNLVDRFEQYYIESEKIIPAVANAIKHGDVGAITPLVDQSQDMTEKLLANQIPETICLAKLGRKLGAVASSAFGAGFGGSVWAMVRKDQAEKFLVDWKNAYAVEHPAEARNAVFFLTGAGPATLRLD